MGVGHQFLLLSSAFLGGQFVGYNSFFVLQVMAVSFFCAYQACCRAPDVPIEANPRSHLCLSRMFQILRLAVPTLAEIWSFSILVDAFCQ